MKCSKRKIISNRKTGPAHYILTYGSGFSEDQVQPGQFVSIKVESDQILLRRPFSIFDVRKDEISIFYNVVGKGTSLLSEKKPGQTIDVLEVLGKGFVVEESTRPAAVVAGGMGVAPLFFLAKKLRQTGVDVFAYLGARTASEVFFEEELKKMGCRVSVTTDDGSKSICGNVCCGLEPDCVKNYFTKMYACGPKAMLKAVAGVALQAKIDCQVSLEEVMGCGFGVCLGCAVKVKADGKEPVYKMVCKDGPVFNSLEVEWE